MIAAGLILITYGIILLELLFKDNVIMVRYLHFGYLALFIFSAGLMTVFVARSLVTNNRKKLLWFLPAFLFISVQYLAPFISGTNILPQSTNNKTQDRASTFNFMSFSVNSRNKDYDQVAQLLKDNPSEVICLQEIPYSRYTLFTSAMKRQGLTYHHVYSRKKSLMILSKQAITPNKTMPYLQATVTLNGQAVKIWNIHSPKSLAKKNYQRFYFDKLKEDVKADTTTYKLVCGDFNSTPHNDIVSEFHTQQYGLLQAAYKHSSAPLSYTYPTPKAIISSPIPLLKIDYLWFTPNFNINHYQRLSQYANSDHYPITASVSMTTAFATPTNNQEKL